MKILAFSAAGEMTLTALSTVRTRLHSSSIMIALACLQNDAGQLMCLCINDLEHLRGKEVDDRFTSDHARKTHSIYVESQVM
jgi:hypothetical protein